MPERKFTPYEYNQLNKYGFDPIKLSKVVDLHIPVEYITGKVEFCNQIFNVNKNTLIPRPETEELIQIAKDLTPELRGEKVTFCDVGTGSGAIGITYASWLIGQSLLFEGYLSDISSEALKVTKQNVDEIFTPKHQNCFTNKIQDSQLKIIESDLFSNYPKAKMFDLIFANLPYIPTSRIDNLDSSVKDFEPLLALDGGQDGLDLIREFTSQAKVRLNINSYVLLEVDDSHISSSEFDKEWNVKIIKDSNGKNRFWVMSFK